MGVEGSSDVVIVGAGPSGCAAGLMLRRAGWDVTVIDAATFPRDKVCGDALSPEAVQLIEELGASAAIERAPHARYTRAAAIFPDGARIERQHVDAGYIVPRMHLDQGLVQALRASGARLLEGQRVQELLRDGDRVCGVRGPGVRWTGRVVIASDGYASVASKLLGQADTLSLIHI